MWTCPKCGGPKSQHGTQCIDCRRTQKVNQRISTIETARAAGLTPTQATRQCGTMGTRSLARWCQEKSRPDLAGWLYFDHVKTPARAYVFDESEIALTGGQWVKNHRGVLVWADGATA